MAAIYIPSVFDSPTWLPRSTLSSGHLGQADLSGFRACVLLCSLAQLTAPVVTHDPISKGYVETYGSHGAAKKDMVELVLR
jgi:hypothetical protein